MTHRTTERTQETSTTMGTGALSLAGATTRMRSFTGAGFQDGDTFEGLIEHATLNEWERAVCTYSAGTITRGTPSSSSTGSTVSFSAGVKTISVVERAGGDIRNNVRRVTSGTSTTVLPSDAAIIIDKVSGAAHAVVLPALADLIPGQRFTIVDGKGDAGTNTITITDTDGAGINGDPAGVEIDVDRGYLTILFDGVDLLLV